MKTLCTILEKIEAGNEAKIRERLDLALGMWTARHGTAHAIVAVSENSVAFADADRNLFVGRYTLTEGKAIITDVRKLLNIREQLEDTSFLDDFANKFIEMISEDQEDEASKLVGIILEMKQKAINGTANTTISEEAAKAASSRHIKEQVAVRRRIVAEAKKQAKKKVFKKKSIFGMTHENAQVSEAMKQLPGAAVALIASLDICKNDPLIEGFITERSSVTGVPLSVRPAKSKTILSVFEKEECEDEDDEKEEKDEKKEDKGEKKGKKESKEKDEDDEDDEKEEKGEKSEKAEESVIVANLKSLTEFIDPSKDFFHRASLAWRSFRADPVTEEVDALLKTGSTAAEIVKASPFLALLPEEEIYNVIQESLDAFDPNDIKAVAASIVAEGNSAEGIKAKENFLTALGDNEISEIVNGDAATPFSTHMDRLFLEAEDFDFGAADDLGSDNLGNDQDAEGMAKTDDLGDDADADLDQTQDDMSQEPEVQFSMPADKAREMFKSILDVIGDEIEDSEEFQDLKARVDDEEQEISGDDVIAILQTIGDYFKATGKDKTDQEERNAETNMGDENLDDMSNITDKSGDNTGAEDGDGSDMGVGSEDDLQLGQ